MSNSIQVQLLHTLRGHTGAVFSLSTGENPSILYSGAGDGLVVKWDLSRPKDGVAIAKLTHSIYKILRVNDDLMVVGDRLGGVHWIAIKKKELLVQRGVHSKSVFGIERLGDFLYTSGEEGSLIRWNIAAMESKEQYKISHHSIRSLLAYEDALLMGASDQNIYHFHPDNVELQVLFEKAHDNSVFCLCFDPSRKYLCSGGRDAHLKVWNLKDEQLLHSIPAHLFTINQMAFSPSGKWLVTASRDKTIKLWDTIDFQLLKVIEFPRDEGHRGSVNDVIWLSENCFATASDDREVKVWGLGLMVNG